MQGSISLPSVRRLLLGGGELHPTLTQPLRTLLPNAAVWTAYGMTECASSITTTAAAGTTEVAPLPVGAAQRLGGSLVGRPPRGIEVAIRQLSRVSGDEEPQYVSGTPPPSSLLAGRI